MVDRLKCNKTVLRGPSLGTNLRPQDEAEKPAKPMVLGMRSNAIPRDHAQTIAKREEAMKQRPQGQRRSFANTRFTRDLAAMRREPRDAPRATQCGYTAGHKQAWKNVEERITPWLVGVTHWLVGGHTLAYRGPNPGR